MSRLGAIWRNCSFSLCKVKELLASSEIYCLGFVTKTDCKILFKVWARFVPRCGVARNMIAQIDLIMASYSGSCWPCMYAYVLSAYLSSLGILTVPYLLSDESTQTMHNKYQRHLCPVSFLWGQKMEALTHLFHLQCLSLTIPSVLEIK